MELPYIQNMHGKRQQQIIRFGGINYGNNTSDGEFSQTENLKCAEYPCLTQRLGRKTVSQHTSPTGLCVRGSVCVIDGTKVLYDGTEVGTVTAGEKMLATINSKIVIFPDKVYYDTATGEFAHLASVLSSATGAYTKFTDNEIFFFTHRFVDTIVEMQEISHEDPGLINIHDSASFDVYSGNISFAGTREGVVADLRSGDIVQFTCEDYEYQQVIDVVEEREGTYTITVWLHTPEYVAGTESYPDLHTLFKAGDGIEITGAAASENNRSRIIREVQTDKLIFDGQSFAEGYDNSAIVVSRSVPDFVCICESNNRLWGAEGSTIWASALGDPSNFHVFDGLDTDSYYAPVGTDGRFTACCAYNSAVLFWKENCLHKIMGDYPSNFATYTYTVPGVENQGAKSLCVINERLFYKGVEGVYMYTGYTPQLVSGNFGAKRYSQAAAGTDGRLYYISMNNSADGWGMFVYDPDRGIWLREDGTHATHFAKDGGSLIYIDDGTKKLMQCGSSYTEEGRIPWSATLSRMDEGTLDRKHYMRIRIRADIDAGAWLKVETNCDGRGWKQVYMTHDKRARTIDVPLLPVRCDGFQIRLSGMGLCTIRSIVREYTTGGTR